MDQIDLVKKLQAHAAEAAVQLSSIIDCWIDLLANAGTADAEVVRSRLEADGAALADILVMADRLGLSNGALQCFGIATFLKRELIYLSEQSPERLLGKKRKGKR